MLSRAAFILVALFWVTMNLLLWREEYGRRSFVGGELPPEVVWRKVLLAQDASPLEIRYHGRRIGFCRWSSRIREADSPRGASAKPLPEGMIRKTAGYQINFEGSLTADVFGNRLRLDAQADFDADRQWKALNLKLSMQPVSCEISASAQDQTLRFVLDDGGGRIEQVWRLSELDNPEALFRRFAGPALAAMRKDDDLFGSLFSEGGTRARTGGVRFEARNDWVWIARTPVRAYRVDIQMPGRRRATVFVSRAGEILRAQLSDELMLVNEQLTNF